MGKLASCLLCVFLFVSFALAEDADNAVVNGGFDDWMTGLPVEWSLLPPDSESKVGTIDITEGYKGSGLLVDNETPAVSLLVQWVSVEPDTLYRFSGWLRTRDCGRRGFGAMFSAGEERVSSEYCYDTNGLWEYVELYGRTGEDQTELCLTVGLGSEEAPMTGQARFDEIKLEKVDEAREGAPIVFLDGGEKFLSSADYKMLPAYALLAGIWLLALLAVFRKRIGPPPVNSNAGECAVWILFLAIAIILRLSVARAVDNSNASSAMLFRLFTQDMPMEQTPPQLQRLSHYLLVWPSVLAQRLGDWAAYGVFNVILINLPFILTDVGCALLVYRAAKSNSDKTIAWQMAVIWLFNPAAIWSCATWGQVDAISALLILISLLFMAKRAWVRALLSLSFAILASKRAVYLLPLLTIAMACGIVEHRSQERPGRMAVRMGLALLTCLGVVLAGSFVTKGLPSGGVPTWPERIVQVARDVVCVDDQQGFFSLNVFSFIQFMKWDNGISERLTSLSWLMFALAHVLAIILYLRGKRRPVDMYLIAALLMLLIHILGPVDQDSVLTLVLLLLALAYPCARDKRLLACFALLSASLLLNIGLQTGVTNFAPNMIIRHSFEGTVYITATALAVAGAALLAITAVDLCETESAPRFSGPVIGNDAPPCRGAQTDWRLNLKRNEYLAMALVTGLYACLALVNLGSTSAPKTAWTSATGGEGAIFDLGETVDFRLTYYGGISDVSFTVQLSEDGESWSEPAVARYSEGDIFKWLWFVPVDQDNQIIYDYSDAAKSLDPAFACASEGTTYPMQRARYVRVEAVDAGLVLFEMGFIDPEGDLLGIRSMEPFGQTGGAASSVGALIDEQDEVPPRQTYLNSFYFDEIYHARTAYEHLHGMEAYEWTHPPMGKVIMMLGLRIFGMTGFGWRFMGTLTGILMLPLMYMLMKQLTHDARLAMISMCLFALDSMHFSLTRIATVDSYAVFWIMLMYLLMIRYTQMDWSSAPFRKTLVPLGLCGICMGMGWATKWICIYASVGLALLLFGALYRNAREGLQSAGARTAVKNVVKTLAFCLLFFVVIPILIYYFSYYWLLKGEGLTGFGGMFSIKEIDRVVELQKQILNYHVGLADDVHYFRSPWYQWPVIWWPLWFFDGNPYMPEGMVSSISCMGNPAVWWFGLVAILFVVVRLCWSPRAGRNDIAVTIGFGSQYLPWVLVPRSTFIYHYFASVPFIILASGVVLASIRQRSQKLYRITAILLLAAAAILFVMFYPLESGLPISRGYARYLGWFGWKNY